MCSKPVGTCRNRGSVFFGYPRDLVPTVILHLLSLLVAVPPGLPAGQDPPAGVERCAEETEVTAVDMVTELPRRGPLRWLTRDRGARPRDLIACADGRTLPVIAVEGTSSRLGRLVLYFDLSLSDDYQVEWAADLLAERAADLVALGEVEVVVADSEAVTVLPPTGDVGAVEEVLGRLAFFSEPRDELLELKLGKGKDRRTVGPEPSLEPRKGGFRGREDRLVQRSLDQLLLALVDRSEGPGSSADPRRAALLVSGGFDLRPMASPGPEEPSLELYVRQVGRALGAYGWRVIPLLPPETRGPVPGTRVGKWRLTGGPLPGAVYEEDRDPDLAEAHLERAWALQRQGRPEQAAEAAQAAVHHFAGDPRTRERQAEALLLLGQLYEELGDPQRARREYRRRPGSPRRGPTPAARGPSSGKGEAAATSRLGTAREPPRSPSSTPPWPSASGPASTR